MKIIRSDDCYPDDESTPSISIERTTQVGQWRVHVHFGQVSDDARNLIALSTTGPQKLLDFIFGGFIAGAEEDQQPTVEMRDQAINEAVDEYELDEKWREGNRLYTTIWATRSVEIPSNLTEDGPEHFWLPPELATQLIKQHEEAAEVALGYVVGRIMTPTSPRIIGDVCPLARMMYLDVDGRSRVLLSRITGSAHATVGHSSWDDTLSLIEDTPLDLPASSNRQDTHKAIGEIGKFYAMAYGEPDPFKRFLWSYGGLETIANAVGTRGRSEILSQLGSSTGLGHITFQDLLWPEDVRETDPNRNIRFRFAVAATIIASDSVESDVTQFIEINRARNQIHQRILPSLRVPTQKAFNLFDKYANPAVEYLFRQPK